MDASDTMCISREIKNKIDSMSRYDIAKALRFNPSGDILMSGDNYIYLLYRFNMLGGMSPEMSKQLGW